METVCMINEELLKEQIKERQIAKLNPDFKPIFENYYFTGSLAMLLYLEEFKTECDLSKRESPISDIDIAFEINPTNKEEILSFFKRLGYIYKDKHNAPSKEKRKRKKFNYSSETPQKSRKLFPDSESPKQSRKLFPDSKSPQNPSKLFPDSESPKQSRTHLLEESPLKRDNILSKTGIKEVSFVLSKKSEIPIDLFVQGTKLAPVYRPEIIYLTKCKIPILIPSELIELKENALVDEDLRTLFSYKKHLFDLNCLYKINEKFKELLDARAIEKVV